MRSQRRCRRNHRTDDELDALDDSIEEDKERAWIDALVPVVVLLNDLSRRAEALGVQLEEVVRRVPADLGSLDAVRDGDVAATLEGVAYYAHALGLRLELALVPDDAADTKDRST